MKTNQTPVQVTGKHTFTQEERDVKLSELLAAIQRKEELDAEKKQVMSGYKNKLDEQESNIKVISNLLNMGFEHRPFSCYLTKDFETGKRVYNEVGTGALISTEPLTAADYQTQMDLEEATIKANNEEADKLEEVITDKVEGAGLHIVNFENGEETLSLTEEEIDVVKANPMFKQEEPTPTESPEVIIETTKTKALKNEKPIVIEPTMDELEADPFQDDPEEEGDPFSFGDI